MPDESRIPAAVVAGMRKSYGGELALAGVDLRVDAGQVVGLLGPNGAGKSTLVSCLGGAVQPDAGTITIAGHTVTEFDPVTSRSHGVAVIYQHFSLAPSLTVAENIFLGAELRRGPFVDKQRQRARAREMVAQFGLDLDPDAEVGRLSPGEQQLVEIAKGLLHEPRVLILDEPTSALSVAETQLLLGRIRSLSRAGLGIIFVSHLLDDVLAVCDHVTVLRDGAVHVSGPVGDFTKAVLVEAIAPTESRVIKKSKPAADVLLDLREVEVAGGIGPLDLQVRSGELVAVFGLLGSGRTELLEALYGAGSITGGTITLEGERYRPRGPRQARERGVVLVPSDRARNALFDSLSASENVLLPHFAVLARAGMLRRARLEREVFAQTAERVMLEPRRNLEGAAYSGGNQQKLMLARWLNSLATAQVLLLDEPTQGVDVGARSQIYGLLEAFVTEPGRCVLFAASETEEVASLADRAVVLNRGRVQGVVSQGPDLERDLLDLAHGVAKVAAA